MGLFDWARGIGRVRHTVRSLVKSWTTIGGRAAPGGPPVVATGAAAPVSWRGPNPGPAYWQDRLAPFPSVPARVAGLGRWSGLAFGGPGRARFPSGRSTGLTGLRPGFGPGPVLFPVCLNVGIGLVRAFSTGGGPAFANVLRNAPLYRRAGSGYLDLSGFRFASGIVPPPPPAFGAAAASTTGTSPSWGLGVSDSVWQAAAAAPTGVSVPSPTAELYFDPPLTKTTATAAPKRTTVLTFKLEPGPLPENVSANRDILDSHVFERLTDVSFGRRVQALDRRFADHAWAKERLVRAIRAVQGPDVRIERVSGPAAGDVLVVTFDGYSAERVRGLVGPGLGEWITLEERVVSAVDLDELLAFSTSGSSRLATGSGLGSSFEIVDGPAKVGSVPSVSTGEEAELESLCDSETEYRLDLEAFAREADSLVSRL